MLKSKLLGFYFNFLLFKNKYAYAHAQPTIKNNSTIQLRPREKVKTNITKKIGISTALPSANPKLMY